MSGHRRSNYGISQGCDPTCEDFWVSPRAKFCRIGRDEYLPFITAIVHICYLSLVK